MQRLQKTYKRIYWKGRLVGEYSEKEHDAFTKKMHEFMLHIGRTSDESLLVVATVTALTEGTM